MSRTITVLQAGQAAAVCTVDRVYLQPAIGQMPPRHPDRIHVAAKCLIAGAILRGDAPGPYVDQVAEASAVALTSTIGAHRGNRRRQRLYADRTRVSRAPMDRPAFTTTGAARSKVAIAVTLAVAYLLIGAAALLPFGADPTVVALVVVDPDAIRDARRRGAS